MKMSRWWDQTLLARWLIAALLLAVPAEAATLTVTSTADAGGSCPGPNCTLRQAIATAAPGDTVTFSLPASSVITLTSAELFIEKNLTIAGPGASLLSVERSSAAGTPQFRIFRIGNGDTFPAAISGLTIANGNTSSGGNVGGGILSVDFGTVTITGCTISGNSAASGGGIFKSGAGETMTIRGCTFSGNSAIASGGALTFSASGDPGTLDLIGCTISGNVAHNAGGIFNTGVLNLINSTLSGNVASADSESPNGSAGGAIVNGSFGTLNLTNSTITANHVQDSSRAGAIGGGIYNAYSATSNLSNSTIAGNSTQSAGTLDDGGGIYVENTNVTAKNTIIADNTAGRNGPQIFGSLTSQGYNLISNNANANITAAVGDQIGTPGAMINPLLGPLQNNGGPTVTRALLSGSTAINAGNDANAPPADQRGYLRNGVSDIGAFEFDGIVPPPLQVVSVVSRKAHGMAGTFDINLPLTPPVGVECRTGGAGGNHQVLVTFTGAVSVSGVSLTSSDGLASATLGVSGAVATVNLAAVANAQTLGITLNNVSNGSTMANVFVPMGVLAGDTTGNGSVTASDIGQTKSQSGQLATGVNFRTDVNANGAITASDIGLVKSLSGSSLP